MATDLPRDHEPEPLDFESSTVHISHDFYDDIDTWETKVRLEITQDWRGLVRFHEARLEDAPDHVGRAVSLAEALIGARELDRAVHLLHSLHRRRPELWSVRDLLLDALYEGGRRPDDIEWVKRPRIFDAATAGERVVAMLHRFGDLPYYAVLERLAGEAYLWFSPDELLATLEADPRFRVTVAAELVPWGVRLALAADSPDEKRARRGARAKARRRGPHGNERHVSRER